MVSKNNKKLLIAAAAILMITLSLSIYLTYYTPSNKLDDSGKVVESINIQNDALTNYFNSIYNSQLNSIENKYSSGTISSEERDKQLNAVLKNREITLKTLNKLENAKKNIFTGNITKQDIFVRIKSMDDLDSDIKDEINATLNGYDQTLSNQGM